MSETLPGFAVEHDQERPGPPTARVARCSRVRADGQICLCFVLVLIDMSIANDVPNPANSFDRIDLQVTKNMHDFQVLSSDEILQKFKDQLPNQQSIDAMPMPDHTKNGKGAIWLNQWVKVINDELYNKQFFGMVGFARTFEEETGRYLVEFTERVTASITVGDGEGVVTKVLAMHPANIELTDAPISPIEEQMRRTSDEPNMKTKKDEL